MPIRLARDATLVRFPSSDGLQLEGRLTRRDRDRGVILCHPHPLHGGSMLTPVIMTAEQVFQESGYTTLIFNFRGVGGSEGTFGEGRAEVADVTGGLAFIEETLGGSPRLQAVAGYSFGSFVGGTVAATELRVRFYLGIAPPLNTYDFGFLKAARCPIALIAPSRDEFCDRDRLKALTLSLATTPWLRLQDTDHFFTGVLPELAQACGEAIRWFEQPPSVPGM
ncbi:MAG TPA: hypothetical protein VLH58_11640 [Candidatus Methylomirabilis sp.]|nr:hypothetical protein [Candidatus Methylomirabilis sp.]HSC72001.1 hypothetical protein [Candidatus Methylomirabilis sp.]